ncbi:helix-turn-helix transcriptional regulator [Nocardiopsis flavescens]
MAPTPTVFIGRGPDLAHLLAEAGSAARGQARTTLVLGDAGVGKTRLLEEYLDRTPLARTAVGACLETSGGTVAFAPFTAALRHLAREVPPGPARAGALARLLPELGPAGPAADGGDRSRLFEAVLAYLEEAAADGGLVLAVEDLHRADASTRDLLLFLARNLGPAPVHLVATVRADDLHRAHPLRRLLPDLERPARATRLDLVPFDREEVAAQAAALRGGSRPDPGALDLLFERSGGNPLFVEALVSAPGDGLPDTSRDLLLRAVDPLPDADRAVLGLAALSGARVHHALLAAVAADLSEDEPDGVLRRAVDARVLRVAGEDYEFRHALLAEAVREDLLPGQRVRGHRRYVSALEAGVPGLAEPERVLRLAHHADAVHDHPRAFAARWAAAGHAAGAFAHPEHLAALERLLELWELLPDPEAVAGPLGVTRGRLLLDAARAAVQTGGAHEALRYTAEGAGQAEGPADRAAFLLVRSQALKALYRRAEGLEALDGAAALLPQGHPDRIAVHGARAALLSLVGGDAEALREARAVLDRARAAGDRRSETDALITLGSVLSPVSPGEARELLVAGRELARGLGMVDAELRAWNNLGVHHMFRLDWHGELRAGREALRRCAELGITRSRGLVHAVGAAAALVDLGRLREAEAELEGYGTGRVFDEDGRRLVLAEIRLAEGDPAGAREHWERGSRPPDAADTHGYAMSDQTGVRVLVREGDLDGALVLARRLVGEERDRRPTQASVDGAVPVAELVRALRRAGRGARADALAGEVGVFLRPSSWWATPYGELRRAQAGARLAADPADALAEWERALAMVRGRDARLEEFRMLEEACRAAAEAGERTRAGELFGELEAGAGLLDTDAPLRERYVEPLRPAAGRARPPAGLTPREAEVLAQVAEGRTNAEIGERLFISAKTVSVHMSNLMGKLGVTNRHAAAVRARELGLAPPGA